VVEITPRAKVVKGGRPLSRFTALVVGGERIGRRRRYCSRTTRSLALRRGVESGQEVTSSKFAA